MKPSPLDPASPDVLEGKVFAVLSYLSGFCIIPLVIKKNNAFVLPHGKQGLVLFVGEVIVFVASIIIPESLSKFCWLALGVLSLWGMIAALRGRVVELPLVWGIAQKITL